MCWAAESGVLLACEVSARIGQAHHLVPERIDQTCDGRLGRRSAAWDCLSNTFPAQAVYLPGSPDFRIRSTDRIVFQLRVVAGAPKSLSTWPR